MVSLLHCGDSPGSKSAFAKVEKLVFLPDVRIIAD
jgi:hypothetical protein